MGLFFDFFSPAYTGHVDDIAALWAPEDGSANSELLRSVPTQLQTLQHAP
jgi:hypothetical protein